MEAKQVRDLMEAYSSIYVQSEQEVLSEDLQGAVEKGLKVAGENPVIKAIGKVIAPVGKGRGTVTQAQQKANIERNKQEDVDFSDHSGENLEEETPKIIGLQPASPRMVKGYPLGSSKVHDPSKMKDKKVKRVAEETDLFDTILEYLVAEGYADTNKAALAIMANMSEEWKQSIVEADSLAAQQARREERLRIQRKREGRPSGGGDFGHDYGKPRAQADAEREQRMKDFINKKD